MARTRRELNPEILRDRLPDNYLNVLNQAESNVRRAVEELIRGYEKDLKELAQKLEKGTFSKELQKKISDLQEIFENDIDRAVVCANDIKEKATELEKKLKNDPALTNLVKNLSATAEDFQDIIDNARTKVQKIGDLSGKVLGAALKKFVT